MKPSFIIVLLANALLGSATAWYEHHSSSDKSIIITSTLFLLMITINLMAAFFSGIEKKPIYKAFLGGAVILVIMYFTLL
jgi:hypothetical protein